MKILYHHRTLGDGAEGIHIAEMINAFRELGHEVRVVSPIGDKTNVTNTKVSRFQRLKQMMPHFLFELVEVGYNLYGYQFLRKAIKEDRPDFIYDRYITFNASSILAGMRYNIPVILEVNAPLALERQNEDDEKLYLNKMAHTFERWICSKANRTIVVSTPLKDYLVNIGVPESNIVVMPNGVNLRVFHPREKNTNILSDLGIHPESIVFGFVGILRPWHGLDMLIDAFSEVSMTMKNCHLILVGDGPIKDKLQKHISELGLNDKVSITGRVSHNSIPDYISVMDIAISPKSTFYSSPMKVIEYMALSKVVIAPDKPNIHDIIEDDINGKLFKEGCCEALRDCMTSIANNREAQFDLGYNAMKKTKYKLNWNANAQNIVRMARDMLCY